MKLRIKGSSIRFRLTRPEVRTLAGAGVLEESVHFPDGTTWRYRLARSADGASSARVSDAGLHVAIPVGDVESWAESERVGIDLLLPLPSGRSLSILVEKDFECLHPRASESERGAYPNPAKGARP
ncbi:MAG TPA: hypothetical protein PKE29_00305 [Phycisphaerales bacterium]|nr:hypothetical protein [Phycisphaerales bacterium]